MSAGNEPNDQDGDTLTYELWRRESGQNWNQAAQFTTANLSFSDTGLAAGTSYDYRVRANDGEDNSAWSTPTSQSTDVSSDTTPPSDPTGLTTGTISSSLVELSWTASTDNIGVTGYDIYRDNIIYEPGVAGTSYNDTSIIEGQSYNYYVIARDAAGNSSGQSNSVNATIADVTPPTAPGNLSATPISANSISLSWTASSDTVGVAAYDLYRDGSVHAPGLTSTSFTDNGLVEAQTYSYYVIARDDAGNSSNQSNTAVAATSDTTPPSAPTGLATGTVSSSVVELSWTGSSDNVGVSGYDVYRNSSLYTSNITGTSYNDTSITEGQSYSYYVIAKDAAGNSSGQSNTINATIDDTTPPTAPGNLTVGSLSANSISLSWTASTDTVGVSGYDLYRGGSLHISSIAATNYTDSGLAEGQSYSYYVIARDAAGNSSAQSSAVVGTTTSSSDPVVVSNIRRNGNQTNGYQAGTLATDADVYTDRPYRWLDIDGGAYEGLTYILTQNDDKGNSNQNFLSFEIDRDSIVYVAYDLRSNPPSWLTNSFTNTGIVLENTDVDLTLFSASFPVGTVSLDGNDGGGNSMYSVILQPDVPSDTEAPTAPSNLAASNITASAADLSWTASTDNVGVIEYDIYRDSTIIATVTGTSFSDTGLADGQSYDYYVVARDAVGNNSAQSNTVSVVTTDITPPSVPGTPIGTGADSNSLSFSWALSTDNVGVNTYDIYRDGVLLTSVTGSPYTDTGLAEAQSYNYYVVARDIAGNESAASGTLLATTTDITAPDTPGAAVVTGQTTSSISISWGASTDNVAVTAYDIYRGGVLLTSVGAALTSHTDSNGLVDATSYTYYAVARDAAGNSSAASSSATGTTDDGTAPSVPGTLSVTNPTGSSLALSWGGSTDNVDVTGYEVYRDGGLVTTVTALNYTDTGLGEAELHSYYIIAFDAAGNRSAQGNTASGTTLDVTSPTAPGTLATSNLTATSVSLTWGASTDNVEVTFYDIYRDSGLLASVPNSVNTYNDTTLSDIQSYSYYVLARDAAGNLSGQSNTVNITTPDGTAPSAPGTLSVTDITTSSISLSWGTSTDNVGVTGYDIYRGGVLLTNVTGTTYTDSAGLAEGTQYEYVVRARDAEGNISAPSNTASGTTEITPDTEAPTAPSNLTVTATTFSSVSLSWTESTDNVGVTFYDIYRGGAVVGSTPSLVFTDTGLIANTPYSYYAVARDLAGNNSAQSNLVNVTTDLEPDVTPPTTPENIIVTETADTITLDWDASTDDRGPITYEIYRDGELFASTSDTLFDDTGLSDGEAHDYELIARDGADNASAPTAIISARTLDITPPGVATGLGSTSVTGSSITLTWNIPTDNVGVTGFEIFRGGGLLTTVTAPPYSDTGLLEAVSYDYQVLAIDGDGNRSALSTVFTETTLDVTPPASPVLSITGITGSSVSLSWTEPADNVGVASYTIYRGAAAYQSVTSTTFVDSAVNQGASYTYYIVALDAAGNTSAESNSESANIPDTQAPSAPSGLAASNITTNTLSLSWTSSSDNVGVTSYDVYRDGGLIGSTSTTTFGDTGLLPSTTYSYYVIARDAIGNSSAQSNTVNPTTESDEPVGAVVSITDLELRTVERNSCAGGTRRTYTVRVRYSIGGDTTDFDHVRVRLDGGLQNRTDSDGLTGLRGLPKTLPGSHIVDVRAEDSSNNPLGDWTAASVDVGDFTEELLLTACVRVTNSRVRVYYEIEGFISNLQHVALSLENTTQGSSTSWVKDYDGFRNYNNRASADFIAHIELRDVDGNQIGGDAGVVAIPFVVTGDTSANYFE